MQGVIEQTIHNNFRGSLMLFNFDKDIKLIIIAP
jgi:hypothetical protein